MALALLLSGGAPGPTVAMDLGVNTHFDQGWPQSDFGLVAGAQAAGIRDTISWTKVEQSPGHYAFTSANSGFIDRACAARIPVLLILTPRNPAYDGGETVYSEAGRAAFARFAAAVVERYSCIAALEIGNEINGHSLKGRLAADPGSGYVAILAAARQAVKARRADVPVLAGSTLSIATGFLERLASAGMLGHVDGLVVHPYLAVPELLPGQMARLRAVLGPAGAAKPVWASEFGFTYRALEDASPHALKMITLMSAAGIARADWYALREEKWYPHMGLYGPGAQPQPALATFRLANTRLLPAGDAQRVEAGDPVTFAYRFGNGPYVLWGHGRAVGFPAGAKAWDSQGRPVPVPAQLAPDPVIVEADGPPRFGARSVFDDTLTNFAGATWSYALAPVQGPEQRLGWIDWNWAPYLGLRQAPNFRAMAVGVSVGKPGAATPRLIERYTMREAGRRLLSACFETPPARPVAIEVQAGGRTLWSATVSGQVRAPRLPLALMAGQAVAISYTAITPDGPQLVRRRIRLLANDATDVEALCAPTKTDMGQAGDR